MTSPTKRPLSPGARHPQAENFRFFPASHAAFKSSIPHHVVSQILRPEMAAFMVNDRVVVRTHSDELCCADTAAVIAGRPPLSLASIEYLNRFPHLVRLLLDDAAIDAAGLELVAKLTRLQHLDLSWCGGADAAGLAAVGKMSQLQRLDLNFCSSVDAAGLAELRNLSQLQHLELNECDGVDAAGLASIGKLSQLRHLELSFCSGVDAAELAELRNLPHLHHLGCDGVGARQSPSQLQHLDSECDEEFAF